MIQSDMEVKDEYEWHRWQKPKADGKKKRIEIPAQATERKNVKNDQVRIEVYHAWWR